MLPDSGDVGPIGEVIRDRRAELQLSQADLADRMCRLYRPTVTGIEVARWERAKRIPRSEARRALEQALGIPLGLLDLAAGVQQAARKKAVIAPPTPAELRKEMSAVEAIRIALVDAGSPILADLHDGEEPPSFAQIEAGLDEVMIAYQSSQFERMLSSLPTVLADANRARTRCRAQEPDSASTCKPPTSRDRRT